MTDERLAALNAEMESWHPREVLTWAWRELGGSLVATSSFQTQSVPLLHLIATSVPEMPVLFLDTGFHFPETLAFRDELVARFGLNVRNVLPELGHDGFRERYGLLYQRDPDLCCDLNKTQPLLAARAGYAGWVAGLRRDQTPERSTVPIVARTKGGQYKVCPTATWTERDVLLYMDEHGLPSHPLLKEGYVSIGCAPCTRAILDGEDSRDGRWSGTGKRECGIHLGDGRS